MKMINIDWLYGSKNINDKKKFLIDYANLKHNIIYPQKNFVDQQKFEKYIK